jgi:hypothetical protein
MIAGGEVISLCVIETSFLQEIRMNKIEIRRRYFIFKSAFMGVLT